jgi:hypothetical protein
MLSAPTMVVAVQEVPNEAVKPCRGAYYAPACRLTPDAKLHKSCRAVQAGRCYLPLRWTEHGLMMGENERADAICPYDGRSTVL